MTKATRPAADSLTIPVDGTTTFLLDRAAEVPAYAEGHSEKFLYSRYPGLPSHPDHAIARRQMTGCGGMVTVDLGSRDRAACVDRLEVISRAASLGGVENPCKGVISAPRDRAVSRPELRAGTARPFRR